MVLRRCVALAAVLGMICVPTGAASQTVVFDGGSPNGQNGLRISDIGFIASAADFQVSANQPITRAEFWTVEYPGMFTWSGTINYYVLADSGGSPKGPPIYSGAGASVAREPAPINDCCGYDEFKYSFDFQPALELQPNTRYWLAINLPGGGSFLTTQAFWAGSTSSFGNSARITGDPELSSWGEYPFDLAFRLLNVGTDTTPPTLNVPSGIATDATGPAGAVVTYTMTAQDDTDPQPRIGCSPGSGTTFAIGDTTVQCSATDADNNTTTAGFTVHVRGASEQLANLAVAATGLGSGTSLLDKVKQVQAYLNNNDVTRACGTLAAFNNQVRALSGKGISPTDASSLSSAATRISVVLAC